MNRVGLKSSYGAVVAGDLDWFASRQQSRELPGDFMDRELLHTAHVTSLVLQERVA